MTGFKMRGAITDIQAIATGRGIRILAKLRKLYGAGKWRKLKGTGMVELPDGTVSRVELHSYEAHGIGRRDLEGQAPVGRAMPRAKRRFVLCVSSGSYKASLEPRRVYRVLDDPVAETKSLVRVVDDSGEGYLFPARLFVPIEVPTKAMPAFATEAFPA